VYPGGKLLVTWQLFRVGAIINLKIMFIHASKSH